MEEETMPNSDGDEKILPKTKDLTLVTEEKNIIIKKDEQPTYLSKEEASKMINDATNKINEKITPINEKIDKFEEKLVTDKASLITVFGIFASIVTFLSFEIQIFKNICDPLRLLGFSLVILASLISFNFLLHIIASFWINEKNKSYPPVILFFIILFFVGGTSLFFLGKDDVVCRENFIFQRYDNDFNSRQLELENNLNNKVNDVQKELNIQIKSLDSRLQNLK